MGALRFSALAVFGSLEQLAVPRWYKRNVLASIKVLGVQGETVSRSSPETRLVLSALLVVSAWARVRSLFLILIWRPNAFNGIHDVINHEASICMFSPVSISTIHDVLKVPDHTNWEVGENVVPSMGA